MKKNIKLLATVLATSMLTKAALAAPINNSDVVKLLDAGMPEEVVLQAIRNGEARFDTSANTLIELKRKGATPSVLKAMLQANETDTKNPAALTDNTASYNPEEITLIVDGTSSIMQYIIPQQRTAARALGFGGVASYASLGGIQARRRTSALPEFIVSVPRNAQADNYMTLASFAKRRNGTREVVIGGGYMSYSSGINKRRVVPIVSQALPDQSGAREGFVLYKVTPEAPLKPGEYALVLYTGEMRTTGFVARAANSYFDFGVD